MVNNFKIESSIIIQELTERQDKMSKFSIGISAFYLGFLSYGMNNKHEVQAFHKMNSIHF